MRCQHYLLTIVLLILSCGREDIYCNALLSSPSLLVSKRGWDCQTLVSVQKISNDDNSNIFDIVRGGDIGYISRVKEGYNQRVSADPSFLSKSIIEVILAALTQYIAEVSRRGQARIIPEIDFVFAGVLTAVCGKYYSMWRVARTVTSIDNTDGDVKETKESSNDWRDKVPNNAFQSTLLDGQTTPTLQSRFLSFILPMPNLYKAGFIASTLGYGLTALLIHIRTILLPHYVTATKQVSVIGASIYTGAFMALVSNIRYQLLQGVIEPSIDSAFNKLEAMTHSRDRKDTILDKLKFLTNVKRLTIILVRLGNGLLGSYIAITGMKAFGLQQLKE